MSRPSSLNFARQDLRNRSFKHQNLSGADFSGADLRGCDFSFARLQAANFDRAVTGQTRKQILLPLGITLIVAIAMFDAASHMLFGALGRTAAEAGWSFVIALNLSLAIAGGAVILPQPAVILSGIASGALLGFYYGGTAAENDSRVAIASAISGGIVTLILLWRSSKSTRRRSLFAAPVFMAGAIAAYALTFFMGTWAIAAATSFSWRSLPLGLLCAAVAIVYFAITLISLMRLARAIAASGGTSFYRADLTEAKFTDMKLENVDFSGAIGFAERKLE